MSHSLPVNPADDPNLRLSDREREAVADFLLAQSTEGRLSLLEYEDRLDQVYKAKIRADLVGVGEGLPLPTAGRATSSSAPTVRPSSSPARAPNGGNPSFAVHFRLWLIFSIFFTLIYLVTDAGGYFWPIWPILGWGVGVASHGASCKR